MIKLITSRLQYKLIVAFVLVLLVPAAFVGIYIIPSNYNELVSRSVESMQTGNQIQAQSIATTLSRAKPDAVYLAQSTALHDYASAVALGDSSGLDAALLGVASALHSYSLNLPEYDTIALLNLQGHEVERIQYADGGAIILLQSLLQDRSQTDYFKSALTLKRGEVYASPVGLNVENNLIERPFKPVIHFATPVYATNDKIAGVVVVNQLASTFLDLVKANNSNETAYLLDASDGTYLAGPDQSKMFARDFQGSQAARGLPKPLPSGNFLLDHPKEGTSLLAAENSASAASQDAPDLQEVYTRVVVPDFPQIHWLLYRTQPTSAILGNVYREIGGTALILLLSVILAVAVALVITRSVVRPVQDLARVAESISQGNWSSPVPAVALRDEIGTLSKAFSKMSGELKTIYDTLEERVRQRTTELAAVVQVSATTTSILDLHQLLQVVVDLTKEHFKLQHVRIYSLDADGANLTMSAASSGPQPEAGEPDRIIPLTLQQSLVAKSANTHGPAINNDVRLQGDARSEATLPMLFGKNLIGVVDMQSAQPNRFSQSDLDVFSSLANQLAVAIRNASLFEEAQAARLRAEQADTIKSAFLANMSHELRTPLNAIINFTRFVVKGALGPVNERQVETLSEVVDSSKHLLSLINDVLDMSKIEAGSLKLLIEDNISLQPLFDSLLSTGKVLLAEKDVEIQTEIPLDLPPIRGDKQRILQILLNIMSNACKFTEHGHIKLRVCQENDKILFAIEDTGAGIAKEDRAAVFEAFKQTSSGLRQAGGTGLGMPISRSLVEAHGGQLWFESEPGKGSTFYVTLPIKSEALIPTFAN